MAASCPRPADLGCSDRHAQLLCGRHPDVLRRAGAGPFVRFSAVGGCHTADGPSQTDPYPEATQDQRQGRSAGSDRRLEARLARRVLRPFSQPETVATELVGQHRRRGHQADQPGRTRLLRPGPSHGEGRHSAAEGRETGLRDPGRPAVRLRLGHRGVGPRLPVHLRLRRGAHLPSAIGRIAGAGRVVRSQLGCFPAERASPSRGWRDRRHGVPVRQRRVLALPLRNRGRPAGGGRLPRRLAERHARVERLAHLQASTGLPTAWSSTSTACRSACRKRACRTGRIT